MKLMALLVFALSLFGVDIGGSSFVTRSVVDGAEVLHSRASSQAGSARFECLRSASGQCHYTVYPRACTSGHCGSEPIKRFTLASGASRQVTGLHDFHLCVSADGDTRGPDCESPTPFAVAR